MGKATVVDFYDPKGLQSTLAASSAAAGHPMVSPHHPITCHSKGLGYDPTEGLWCDHVQVGPDDGRTRDALTHSIGILILEMAHKEFGS